MESRDKIKIVNFIIWFIGVSAISIFIGKIFNLSEEAITFIGITIISIIIFIKVANNPYD